MSDTTSVDRFMQAGFIDQVRTATGWAESRLQGEFGIDCPSIHDLCELIGTTYNPSRHPDEREQGTYETWIARVQAAYALGFAMGQQVPHFGRVQREARR